MCGRYAIFAPPQKLKDLFGTENLLELPPRYNAAPGQELPVIVHNRAGLASWGFGDMINARSETVSEKPLFRESWHRRRRCLIPANGFYEWKDKQPFFINRPDQNCLALAGLWLKEKDGVKFVILTKAADGAIKYLHERMPVILRPDQANEWFSGDEVRARELIALANANDLLFHPVDRSVGRVANDDETLIRAVS
ncbi:MAG TPA: SOS response-associated peptidase [Patescibacteria group bacterium]|nr:SOS response-associated peptidase [Patescibacteria group bacterium]